LMDAFRVECMHGASKDRGTPHKRSFSEDNHFTSLLTSPATNSIKAARCTYPCFFRTLYKSGRSRGSGSVPCRGFLPMLVATHGRPSGGRGLRNVEGKRNEERTVKEVANLDVTQIYKSGVDVTHSLRYQVKIAK